jgi:hypothetical protein
MDNMCCLHCLLRMQHAETCLRCKKKKKKILLGIAIPPIVLPPVAHTYNRMYSLPHTQYRWSRDTAISVEAAQRR